MALNIFADFSQHPFLGGDNGQLWKALSIMGCLAFLVCLIIFRLVFHPIAHIPGPTIAKLTGLWRSKKYADGQWHRTISDIHRKYGRVVRIAPNEISIVDENGMKNLYGHSHNARKTSWYSVWDPPSGTHQLFSELDKRTHSFLRKRLSAAFAMSSVLKYEPHVQGCLDLLWEKFRQKAKTSDVVNMSIWTNALAYDVIGELGFGAQFGHLRTETDVGGVQKIIYSIFRLLSNLGHWPGQAMLVDNPITRFFGQNPFNEFSKMVKERVQIRVDSLESVKRDDMLGHFCRMKDIHDQPANLSEIIVEAMNLIGAGADTTSIGMRTCLFYLSTTPSAYKRLQEEVDAFHNDNHLNEPMMYLQTQKLPYLQAVVKESMRLLPSIVFQLLRHAPPDFVVRGIRIPENTPVGISPIAQNRDKEIFGQDADEFRPERWTESTERTKYMDTNSMTFGGSGPRMCIGKNIALVEIHKFLAQFVRQFNFEVTNKERPWRITTFWFAYQHDFFLRIENRNLDTGTSDE